MKTASQLFCFLLSTDDDNVLSWFRNVMAHEVSMQAHVDKKMWWGGKNLGRLLSES